MAHPVAQISCWVDGDSLQGCKPPEGFHVNKSLDGKASRHNSQLFTDLPLYPGRSITVGRDHHMNDISINHPYVSRKHFIIYSVVYDPDDDHVHPPLIYVRDRQSLEGTYVDETCIGDKDKSPSLGFYLSRDVVVTIKPHWKFRVSLLDHSDLKSPLTAVQLKESSLFGNRYMVSNRVLGSGSFASVHLAVDAKTGRQLACKIHDLDYLSRFSQPQDLIQRILNETDILGKLRHPNLPTFEYAYKSRHTLYTFTELATGGDLFSMRVTRGVFTEQDAKLVILQIVNAVKYLHEGGIAHRDLKPENVLFSMGPHVTGRVIVSDLGFAKSTASGRMHSQVGTKQYMAPEVEYGQTHGLAVDIWSLGMIGVFLLAPDHLVTPSNLMKISQAAISEWLDAVFEDQSHQKISHNCQEFIRSCLMFEPARRIGALQARRHIWFQRHPDKGRFKYRMKESTRAWKPIHVIAPPIQQLPDLGTTSNTIQSGKKDSAPRLSTSPTKLGKRKLMSTTPSTSSSQQSPYFAGINSEASKRLKKSGMEDMSAARVGLVVSQ
ncbi:kinase-like protein [Annulohypoxylon bovei var. microspora]|nr:kinase-like protein [Annulohypoxylon bovei var. microspora]